MTIESSKASRKVPAPEVELWQRIKRRLEALRVRAAFTPPVGVPSWKHAPCHECGVPAGISCLRTCPLGTRCDCPTHKLQALARTER